MIIHKSIVFLEKMKFLSGIMKILRGKRNLLFHFAHFFMSLHYFFS